MSNTDRKNSRKESASQAQEHEKGGFRNAHLSYSRVARYAQCPRSFELHYIEKLHAAPGEQLGLGKMVHRTLEDLVREHVAAARHAVLDEGRALEIFKRCWSTQSLGDGGLFAEGAQMLRNLVRSQGALDPRFVLAIEHCFELQVGRFKLIGFIDRVDWIDDETIEIIDYKTNHQLFDETELAESHQLSVYEAAARKLWPWAKRVKLTMWMLRHGVRQSTSRTAEQLVDALAYAEAVGERTEVATAFPARLNEGCSYCDQRLNCEAFASAVSSTTSGAELPDDLEEVAREQRRLTHLLELLRRRREKCEVVLRRQLKNHDELVLGGTRVRMYHARKRIYPPGATLEALARVVGLDRDALMVEVAVIDGKRLKAFLDRLEATLNRGAWMLLRAELESLAQDRFSPKLWMREEQRP